MRAAGVGQKQKLVRAAGRTRIGHGVSSVRGVAAHEHFRKRRAAAQSAKSRTERNQRAGCRSSFVYEFGRIGIALSGKSFRRPAAAHRSCARDRDESESHAARRTAFESRSETSRVDAFRNQRAAEKIQFYDHFRHARSVRSDGAVRPHDGYGYGKDRPNRYAAQSLQQTGEQIRAQLFGKIDLCQSRNQRR